MPYGGGDGRSESGAEESMPAMELLTEAIRAVASSVPGIARPSLPTGRSWSSPTCPRARRATRWPRASPTPFSGGVDRMALGPRKPRYYVTVPTWLFASLKRVLSHRALDRILARV